MKPFRLVLTKTFTVDAHHKLKHAFSKQCLCDHGHTYSVTIRVGADRLNDDEMVIDFGKLKQCIQDFDHASLNQFLEQPSTEAFAQLIAKRVQLKLDSHCTLISVVVRESPTSEVLLNCIDTKWTAEQGGVQLL